jgi:hypothetical protein
MTNEALKGPFATPDGRAHLVLYPDLVSTVSTAQTDVIEIEARFNTRLEGIRS